MGYGTFREHKEKHVCTSLAFFRQIYHEQLTKIGRFIKKMVINYISNNTVYIVTKKNCLEMPLNLFNFFS